MNAHPNKQPEPGLRPREILEDFFTAEELMQKFQISKRTLRSWVQQELLPAPKRIGNVPFWDAAQVQKRLLRMTAQK